MFLDFPNQASRYQGTLLKTVKNQFFQSNHKPEAYYTAALTAYRFEVAIRRLSTEDRVIRPFKYFLLFAFRCRFEHEDFPGTNNRRISDYCDNLQAHISDTGKSKLAFDECVFVVKQALANLSLPLERDSAKSRPLFDEVRKCAKARAKAAST